MMIRNRFVKYPEGQFHISFILIFFVCLTLNLNAESNELKEMQGIYFYAKKFYSEGKYEQSLKEFEKILSVSPEHKESLRMINVCKKKINLTSDLINQALDKYKSDSLTDALEKLDLAFQKDDRNFQVKTLMIKVLIELGMEYNLTDNYRKALEYFEKAKELDSEDEMIKDMIRINKAMLESSFDLESQNKEVEDSKKKISVFEKYQRNQVRALIGYAKEQSRIQEILDESNKEKQKLYKLLTAKEELLTNILNKQKDERKELFGFMQKNLAVIGGVIGITVVAGFFLIQKQLKQNRFQSEIQRKFQEKVFKSFRKSLEQDKTQHSEFEKKVKKLEIIESELVGENPYENQVALNMIEQFLNDIDYKVKLKAVKVLHRINSQDAIGVLEEIIKQETGEFRQDACELLGEIRSRKSISLLLMFADSQNDDIKKSALFSLSEVIKDPNIGSEMKTKIEDKINKVYKKGDWVVM